MGTASMGTFSQNKRRYRRHTASKMSSSLEDVGAVFESLGDLEKDFAQVELDALRNKEYSLKPLYTKRKALLDRVPDFWPTVFGNGPEELWTDAMDYFMSAQDDFPGADELDMDDEEEDEEDAPELVTAEEARPNKRQRKN